MRRLTLLLILLLPALFAFDRWPSEQGGGGSGGVPGLAGSTGNDETIDYIYNLSGFESLPNWPRVYFSAEGTGGDFPIAGDDTGPCTQEAPCESITLAASILARGRVIVVLDGGDTWDTHGAGTEWGTGTVFPLTCPAGSGGADDFTDEPCGFMISSSKTSRAVLNCNNFDFGNATGAEDALFELRGTGSGYWGFAGIEFQQCPRTPRGSFTSPQSVFNSTGGNGVLVNIRVNGGIGLESHFFGSGGAANEAAWVALNLGGISRPTSDFDENCVGGSAEWGCGTDGAGANLCDDTTTPYPCCHADTSGGGAGTSQCGASYHAIEFPAGEPMTFISNATIQLRTDQLNDTAVTGGNMETFPFITEPKNATTARNDIMTIIGPTLSGPSTISFAPAVTGTERFGISRLPANTGAVAIDDTLTALYARVTVTDWPDCGALCVSDVDAFATANGSGNANSHRNLVLFQNTVTDMERGVMVAAQFAGDSTSTTIYCSVFDDLYNDSGARAMPIATSASNAGTVTIWADGSNIYDSDETATTFTFQGINYTTAATVPFACANGTTCGPDTDFFGDGVAANDSGGIGVAGSSYVVGTTSAICAAGEECDLLAPCPHQLVWSLGKAFIPEAVVGTPIRALVLGTHYKGIGAK